MRFYTDYSGFECPRWGFSAMEKILRADTDNDEFDEPEPWAKFCRTCDYAEVPSQICCAIHESTGEGCHLSDIIARLHPTAQDWIKSAAPDELDTVEVKAQAHDVIGEWLLDNCGWCFKTVETNTCPCQVCGDECPTWPAREHGDDSLRINASGVTCVAWSNRGPKQKQAHTLEIPCHIWLAERKFLAEADFEDVGFMECVAGWPRHRLVTNLGDTHHVVWIIVGPQDKGWPGTRTRLMAAVVNKRRWRWVGPPTPEECAAAFKRRFGRTIEVGGEVFFLESDEARMQYYVDIANKRPGQEEKEMTISDLLELEDWEKWMLVGPPGLQARMRAWMDKIPKDRDEPFILDADHWPQFGSGGRMFPGQITHSTVMKVERGKWQMATPKEHLQAMGFSVGNGSDEPDHEIENIFKKINLSEKEQKHAIGNGMHIHTMSAWMCFVLAQIERVDEGSGVGA